MQIKVKIYSCYELTYTKIYKDILKRIYGENFINFEILVEIEKIKGKNIQSQRNRAKFIARTIRIYENEILKYIVALSNTNYDDDKKAEFLAGKSTKKEYKYGGDNYHANTYLTQGISKIFNYYFENENVNFLFYLLDTNRAYPHNLFNILSYRELETIGFKILNIDEIDFSEYEKQCKSKIDKNDLKFASFSKFTRDILYISSKNSGNNPSFLEFNEQNGVETYIYTFKSLSAQCYDTLLKCWCMKILAKKEKIKIEFRLGRQYFAFDNNEKKVAEKLTEPTKMVFKNANINFKHTTTNEFMQEKQNEIDTYLRFKAKNELRNSQLFKSNLLKKGVPNECVLCGKINISILEAAHLWEVNKIKNADIKEINDFIKTNNLIEILGDSKYKNEIFYKKYSLVNCGDNGIWLCKNHHGLFDKNFYCFDSENGKIIFSSENSADLQNFIDCVLSDLILTKATKAFLKQRFIYFR